MRSGTPEEAPDAGCDRGDIIGSIYKAAIADALMSGGDLARCLRAYARRYPGRAYGDVFARWAHEQDMPAYGSWGNGAAMRVSAIAPRAADGAKALATAARTAEISHGHLDAVAGTQATVLAAAPRWP